jgi:recombinational DNA repair ATPase RecF
VNVFTGKNGSGKTNILEAIYFLVNARMLPGQKITNVLRTDAESLFLNMTIIREDMPVTYGITYDVVKKK